MNVSIFVIVLTLFSIDSLFDLSLRYTLLPHLTLIFFFHLFIIRLMCFSVIIVAYFLVS